MLERGTLQQFHGDEWSAGVLVNVVNGADKPRWSTVGYSLIRC